MRKTTTIDDKGRDLFEAMQQCIVDHNLSGIQTLCAASELFCWVMLTMHGGNEKATVQQFDALEPSIREAIKRNAPFFEKLEAELRGALQ